MNPSQHVVSKLWSYCDLLREDPTGRWRAYDYESLVARYKCSLDLFWLRDESLEASENLPEPDVLAGEIAETPRAALLQFEEVAADLQED